MKQLVEFLINSKSIGIIKDNEFINLGLSVFWAKCNIGAEEETDYGHYYQWGSTTDNSNTFCEWISDPFNDGEEEFYKSYFDTVKDKVCPNDILAKEYDIAYQTYKNNKVHMPTKDNFDELISGTNNKWITNYNDSGVNGILFTGKNGNSIFIPAAGYRSESSTNNIGSYAYIWSASIDNKYNGYSAWYLSLYKNNIGTDVGGRYGGQSVRAVKEK